MQLVVLVLANHIRPGFNDLILLDNLVGEFARLLAFGYHHEVVDAFLRHVDEVVVGMTIELILAVYNGEHRVGRLAKRQIDRFLRVVGYGLCIGLGAGVQHIHNLLRLVGDNLLQQLVLRIDEP